MFGILDLIFPPLCLHCRSYMKTNYLCETCWIESALIDPESRCIHCFDSVSEKMALCMRCRKDPLLPFPRAAMFEKAAPIVSLLDEEAADAIAGFAYYQWLRLDAPEPDFVIPVRRNKVAKKFAEFLDKPCPDVFQRISYPISRKRYELKKNLIEEKANILLFDHDNEFEELKMACGAISEAFPKKVYLLSLLL